MISNFLGHTESDDGISNYKASHIIIDNEAAIAMRSCNKDTAGNRHVLRGYPYVRQGITLKEHIFDWISTKKHLADPLTKQDCRSKFKDIWDTYMYNINSLHEP